LRNADIVPDISAVSNSNYSEDQMRTYKVTRESRYDADPISAVPELARNSFYILFPAKGIVSYRQIISRSIYVRLEGTWSLAGRALKHRWV